MERLTMDETYELSIIQVLNDLGYLKAKGHYEKEQAKKWQQA